MNSCKLSDRFTKINNENLQISSELTSVDELTDAEELLTKLFCKVNSVPVWHDYSKEEQISLSSIFIKKNSETFDESLLVNVVGLGIIQPLLENENVSQVLIDSESSIKIVIGNNIYDTEIYLSDLQRVYLENCVKAFKGVVYHDSKFDVEFVIWDNNRITINKV